MNLIAILFFLCTMIASAVGFRFPAPRMTVSALNTVKVAVTEEEPIENALRRFKKVVNQKGHLMELRFKEEWENAHDKRKRKRERCAILNKMERTNMKYEDRAQGMSEYNS